MILKDARELCDKNQSKYVQKCFFFLRKKIMKLVITKPGLKRIATLNN